MRKTLTAGLTALSLVLIPAAPVQAESNDGLNHAILGLLAAGAIGLAINQSQTSSTPKVTVHHTPQARSQTGQVRFGTEGRNRGRDVRHTRRVDPLPSRCFRQVELRNGRIQNVFTASCLDRRYNDVVSLPRQCLTRIGGRDGSQRGYEASCLRERGFRTDRNR